MAMVHFMFLTITRVKYQYAIKFENRCSLVSSARSGEVDYSAQMEGILQSLIQWTWHHTFESRQAGPLGLE